MQKTDDRPSSDGASNIDECLERYLSSKQVRDRYANASQMWLHRRLHDSSGFPLPMLICGRRFWKLSELTAWELSRATRSAAA